MKHSSYGYKIGENSIDISCTGEVCDKWDAVDAAIMKIFPKAEIVRESTSENKDIPEEDDGDIGDMAEMMDKKGKSKGGIMALSCGTIGKSKK